MRSALRALAAAIFILAAACSSAEPSLRHVDGAFIATGVIGDEPGDGWSSVLEIRASDDPGAPTLAGDFARSGDRLTFIPSYQPAPGVTLHATFRPRPDAQPIELATTAEDEQGLAPTSVAAIYPTSDTWPENALRFYIEFSGPMSAGFAYEHIRILDDTGAAVEGPFVEIEPELWDPGQTRLTILFDPGRVKRGLVDNEQSGPPLIVGRTVTLEVDGAWPDASGQPLGDGGFRKIIEVGPSIRQPLDVTNWTLTSPARPTAPLTIDFPRPLDSPLAIRVISVMRGDEPVGGTAALSHHEMRWTFTPDTRWAPGDYTVRVDGRIEDVAGNRLGRVFDVDRSDPSQSTEAVPFAELPFTLD